ncbi:MAG TPA: efflux RND transporter periplasmic adaptor subunit [Bacteroidia bacterium]|nr:efflux RND transporter periplasmic adaptor subunit [Bacteroidia bacterium]
MNRIFLFTALLLLFSCEKRKVPIGENEFYVCSMDPQVMEKEPVPCPICKMPLTKITIDKSQLHLIKLSDDQIKLGNIQTDTVRQDSIWQEKILTGVFAVNQNLQEQISSRFGGRIERLYHKVPGEEIKNGELIYEIYSLELMQAEEEYLFAIRNAPVFSSNTLIESAKNRLLLWGLTEAQVENLERENSAKIINPIYSKAEGTIMEIPFNEGDYINEGSVIYKLADLSSLWVEAQLYAGELNAIALGNQVQVIPEAFPEEIIDGVIEFTNPQLQPGSKINLVRVKVPNERRRFIPGTMAYVLLKSGTHPAFTLPIDAVIQTKKLSHVWIRNADGSFQARKVETGMQTKSRIEILSGLKEGEAVVISGAYLIYSDYVFKRGSYPLASDETSHMDSVHNNDVPGKPLTSNVIQANNTNTVITPDGGEVIYRVQIMVSGSSIPSSSNAFKDLPDVYEYTENNLFKYTTGVFTDIDEALAGREKAKEMGFTGAFVIAFKNGKRIN